jgi:nucleoid-associated protein YgaU
MGKEIKIGLVVIAVLLSVFGGVLYVRLSGDTPTVEKAGKKGDKKEDEEKAHAAKKSKKKLAGGPSADEVAANGRSHRRPSTNVEPGKSMGRYGDAHDDSHGDPLADSHDSSFADSFGGGGHDADGRGDKAREGGHDEKDQSFAADRYAKRYGNRPSAADEVSTDVADGRSDEDDRDESAPADQVDDDGQAHVASDTISDRRQRERFDRDTVGGSGDRYSKQARLSGEIELESSQPPSELEPNESEAPLTTAEDDELEMEPRGGGRFERRLSDDDRRVLPVSRRDDAAFEPNSSSAQDDAPAEFEGETYTVRPNDNYWTISQRVYGTGAYFKALQEFNRERFPNPDRLDVDDVVTVPALEVLEQTYPKLCPKRRHVAVQRRAATKVSSRSREAAGGRLYTVVERDTLFDIARRELGSAERWVEIHELNRDQLGDEIHYLTPGTKLVLPSDAPAATRAAERTATRRKPGPSRR